MRRNVSQAVVVIYWLLLALCVLAAISITVALVTTGVATSKYMPTWTVLVLAYGVPALIGWRIWVHRRAQRTSAVVEVFDTEQEDG